MEVGDENTWFTECLQIKNLVVLFFVSISQNDKTRLWWIETLTNDKNNINNYVRKSNEYIL